MKLLLTSGGITNNKISNAFLKLVDKKPNELRVLFTHILTTNKEEVYYINESKKQLLNLGIKEENIRVLNYNHHFVREDFNVNVVYACGGNTFDILDAMRRSGFTRLIKSFKGLYIGVSAGSIIAGPSIRIAGWGSEGDKNNIKLRNLKGLKFTKVAVHPHYKEEHESEVNAFKKIVKYPVIAITDEQAILVISYDKYEVI